VKSGSVGETKDVLSQLISINCSTSARPFAGYDLLRMRRTYRNLVVRSMLHNSEQWLWNATTLPKTTRGTIKTKNCHNQAMITFHSWLARLKGWTPVQNILSYYLRQSGPRRWNASNLRHGIIQSFISCRELEEHIITPSVLL
jgi:hypothetical protein